MIEAAIVWCYVSVSDTSSLKDAGLHCIPRGPRGQCLLSLQIWNVCDVVCVCGTGVRCDTGTVVRPWQGRQRTVVLISRPCSVKTSCCDFCHILFQDSSGLLTERCLATLSGTPMQVLWCSFMVYALAVYIFCWSCLTALMLCENYASSHFIIYTDHIKVQCP